MKALLRRLVGAMAFIAASTLSAASAEQIGESVLLDTVDGATYVGTIAEMTDEGVTIEGPTGRVFIARGRIRKITRFGGSRTLEEEKERTRGWKEQTTPLFLSLPRAWTQVMLTDRPHLHTLAATVSHRRDFVLYSVRYLSGEEGRAGSAWEQAVDLPLERTWELALMGGAAWKARYLTASATAGPSVLGGIRRGDFIAYEGVGIDADRRHKERDLLAPGLGWQLDLAWTPYDFIGLAVTAYGDMTVEESFHAFGFSVRIGNLSDRVVEHDGHSEGARRTIVYTSPAVLQRGNATGTLAVERLISRDFGISIAAQYEDGETANTAGGWSQVFFYPAGRSPSGLYLGPFLHAERSDDLTRISAGSTIGWSFQIIERAVIKLGVGVAHVRERGEEPWEGAVGTGDFLFGVSF